MRASRLALASAAIVALPVAIGPSAADAAPITFSASGANPAGIQTSVDAFRTDLGTLNANVAGSFGSGRREINWDGVPDALSAPNNLPANFFNVNSPRGTVFSTSGTGFQVSANAASGTPVEFGNINPTYPSLFQTFSSPRLFTALGSNVLDVNFFVPGSTTPALTRGFGSVFTDVDLANTTSLAFYDASNVLLDTFFVPPGQTASESLSFFGADYGSNVVSRVRITSGNAALGPNEAGSLDLVVMDDFLYGEPVAATANVPEPGTMALLATGIIGLGLVGSRRRRRV
jgi:hypothetical protein